MSLGNAPHPLGSVGHPNQGRTVSIGNRRARRRANAVLAWLVILSACAPCLFAEGPQTWNELEYTVARSSRFELSVDGTHRFAKTVGDLQDRRLGAKFEYEVGRGVRVGAGYLLRNRDVGDYSANENRFIAGISYPILRGTIAVEGATLFERHVVPVSDFNRFKQQFEVFQCGKTLSPWLYQQLTFKQGEGFVRSRSRFGLKWRRSSYSFKAAYQFESYWTGIARAPRHAIYTEVSIDRPLWSGQ